MKTYGVGVLGCGGVWDYHKLAFEKSQRIRVVRVFDPARERAVSAAGLTGAKVAATADEVINDPAVEIVAVLTPVFTHVELVEKAAKAGKHLMLEKPMANTLADGERIVRAIDRAGIKCYHPTLRALTSDLFEKLREWTAPDGVVGPVKCGFFKLIGAPYAPSGWLLDRKLCFPAAEYDPHVFDIFLSLTGDSVSSVTCHAGNYCRPVDQDDVTSMQITFKGRRYLQFDVNWVVDPTWKCGSWQAFELVCERGLIKHKWFSAEWFSSTDQGSFQSARLASGGDRWDHYHGLIDAIEKNTDVHPNHHDALKYVRIQDAAIRSSKLRQTVDL